MASTPYSMKGGFEENEGETADKWVENYRNNLSKNALFGSDMSNVYKDLQKQSIKFAMQSGSTAKEAKRLYNIDTEEGLNRVLQEELIGITKNNDPRLIKGKIGTKVKITVKRDNDTLNFNVKRANITVSSISSDVYHSGGINIGYIKIDVFAANTASQFSEALKSLEKENIGGR